MSAPITSRQNPAVDEAGRRALQRRSLTVVVISQVFGGAGLAAGVTVGALLAEDMLGGDAVSGLPAALFTLGSALAAYGVGRLSQAAGRRAGLAAGFAAGTLGALGVALAALLDSPALLFAALFVYGAGTATNLQARYAGTDLAPAHQRGTAISIAMVATTFGAVAGPNSVQPTGRVAEGLGFPPLAGPFLLATLAYGLAGLVLFTFLRPDPLLIARASLAEENQSDSTAADESAADAGDGGPPPSEVSVGVEAPAHTSGHLLITGGAAMVLTQMAMVAIMTMTPIQMTHHGHGLGAVGFVIGMHIAAMFLPSPLTGLLVDRVGRMPMVVAAGVTLLASGLIAATAPGESMTLLTLALVLLGLGWNFGIISGTALVIDATALDQRARIQGAMDVLIAIAGAGGGALSGFVVATTSYATLALGGGLLALLLVPVVAWSASAARRVAVG